MKRLFLLTTVLACSICLCGITTPRKIVLRKISLADAKKAASREHKLIFMAIGTSWCGPCKHMEQNVFTNDSVSNYYNTHFVCIKLDLEHGEGIEIGNRFHITSVPCYIFLDSTDNLAYKMSSAMSADLFLAHARRANDPNRNLLYYAQHFEEKQNNLRFIENYLDLLYMAGLDSKKVLERYLSLQQDSLISAKNWTILRKHAKDIYSPEFAFLVKNQKAYATKVSNEEEVTDVLNRRIEKEFERIIDSDTFSQTAFDSAKSYVASLAYDNGDKLVFEAQLKAAIKLEKWEEYTTLCLEKAEHFYLGKPVDLQYFSEIAYYISNHFPPGPLLDKAEFWVKQDVEKQPGYFPCITYAGILYKKRNYDEALKQAIRAKDFAKQTGYKLIITESETLIKSIRKEIYSVKN